MDQALKITSLFKFPDPSARLKISVDGVLDFWELGEKALQDEVLFHEAMMKSDNSGEDA